MACPTNIVQELRLQRNSETLKAHNKFLREAISETAIGQEQILQLVRHLADSAHQGGYILISLVHSLTLMSRMSD